MTIKRITIIILSKAQIKLCRYVVIGDKLFPILIAQDKSFNWIKFNECFVNCQWPKIEMVDTY